MQCCTMELCSNLQIGKTIIVMHYAMLLDHLNEEEELKRKKKKPRLAHKKIPPKQLAPSHKATAQKKVAWIWLSTGSLLPIFPGFGPIWFILLCKFENGAQQEKIVTQWRCHHRCYSAHFTTHNNSHFCDGWTKCAAFNGDCINKN